MKPEENSLVKVVDKNNVCWYGFYSCEDKDNKGERRVRLNACLNNVDNQQNECGTIDITAKVITGVKRMYLSSPVIQETYHHLLIEASEFKGQTLFSNLNDITYV